MSKEKSEADVQYSMSVDVQFVCTEPLEVLKKSSREPQVTANSVTVSWQSTDICSSFFQEYAFQLFEVTTNKTHTDYHATENKP